MMTPEFGDLEKPTHCNVMFNFDTTTSTTLTIFTQVYQNYPGDNVVPAAFHEYHGPPL